MSAQVPQPALADQLLSIKETLVGIAIAFSMAFVFRGFVIEGFVIPTGSMAPTLLGQHYKATGPESGYTWDIGPKASKPFSREDLSVTDPMLGTRVTQGNTPKQAGDRVFVVKYLDGIHEPKRWDVVVFKNPGTRENYIKRLIGKPGEQIALVDGDVFVRDFEPGQTPRNGLAAWAGPGWSVARKSERVQRAVFQPVYDSRYTPLHPGPGYRAPFEGGPGWTGLAGESASPTYAFSGVGTGTLSWRDAEPINDWYPYNEMGGGTTTPHFPVSDIAVAFGVEPEPQPDQDAIRPTVNLTARGYDFRARLSEAEVTLEMSDQGAQAWHVLDTQPLPAGAFTPGRVTQVEFWHVDQTLWFFIDGSLIAGGPDAATYDLTPAQRVEQATGMPYPDAINRPGYGNGVTTAGGLADNAMYRKPRLWIDLAGGPAKVHHMSLHRDLHYQINPSKQTHGGHPDYFPTLTDTRYFVCGDNSPNSADSRLWSMGQGSPDPWVAFEIDPKIPSVNRALLDDSQMTLLRDTIGTVHRDLLIGQGFLVYFPAPKRVFGFPVPDLGRARWIW
ncbi:MAG: signal peptidase I [Phycisphaerales bacterium]|jgi:signal peptidase I